MAEAQSISAKPAAVLFRMHELARNNVTRLPGAHDEAASEEGAGDAEAVTAEAEPAAKQAAEAE